MEFTKSLLKGKLIKRYKRFFVDVNLNKEIVTAHCPNTGSMKGLLDEGNEVYLFKHDDPKRKLKYGLEIIKAKKINALGKSSTIINKDFTIACKEGAIIPIFIQREGKKVVSLEDFLRGFTFSVQDELLSLIHI